MKRFVLEEFRPATNYVIEASAGTGKTYNIVEIVKKLVNEYKYNLNEILIVTYTDKAAGELKDRIRNELKNQNVDNAPIFTIHSFCQNAIKEFGISASLPLSLNVVNDEDLKDFAHRYVREGDILADISSFACAHRFSFDDFIKVLCEALNKYYLNNNYEEDSQIIELEPMSDNEREIANLSNRLKGTHSIEDLFDFSEDIKNNYETFKNSSEPKAQEFATELENKYKENFNFNGKSFSVKTKWSKDPLIDEELKEAFKFFYEIKVLLSKLSPYKYLTSLYLKDFYEKWQIEKEINKSQTFNDMIRFVRESVLPSESLMKTSLRNKYKYAIIDEFQDTNQLQFDIFKNVFMCEGHNIIVVGDPKQSIYSFQGADIEVYYKAKQEIEASGGLICDLNKNFRSTTEMVQSCNKLFKYYDFDGTEFNDCDSLKDGDKDGTHKVLFDGKPISAFWIDNDDGLKLDGFAKTAAEAITECCSFGEDGKTRLQVKDKKAENYRNVSFKDFAVLAKSRSEMLPIENIFKRVGIPFTRYKDQNLFMGKECADWMALLNAINANDFTGNNRKVFKKVLFTQFFGLSIKLASDAIYESDDNEQIKTLKKWRQIANERKWEDLFDDIIVESGIIDRMTSLSQIQSLGIYKQISNYCVDYLSNNHSIDELIKQLSKMASGSSGEDAQDGPIVEKSTNFDCVQVMTMHASKGLQFPVVIGVCGYKNGKANSVYTYHTKDGTSRHMLGFDSNEQTKNEEIEEWKRLFYVGFTRAQFIMMLPNYEKFSSGKDFLKKSITSYIADNSGDIKFITDSGNPLSDLKPIVKGILAKNAKSSNIDSGNKDDQDKLLQELIKEGPGLSTYKHSYSSFSHSANDDDEFDSDEQFEGLEQFDTNAKQIKTEVDADKNHDLLSSSYPKGKRAGTALHEVFEKIDFKNYSSHLENIIHQAFKNQNIKLNDDCLKLTTNMIENVLEAKLPVIEGNKLSSSDSFTLSSIMNKDKHPEVEFNFNFENENLKNYCNGFIDLLFKYNDRFCLLDWKSDRLNENFTSYADNDELKKHVDGAYSIQRVLYSYCLIKWLKSYYKDMSEVDIFTKYFGGIYYVFLRGCSKGTGNGVYCQTWNSWGELEESFREIIANRTGGNQNE